MSMQKLFEPIKIGNVEIKNRIAMAPMANLGLITPDGCFTKRAVDYYVERAKGGTGLLITGAVKVENEIEKLKMPSFPCITINPTHFIQTASELTERVHAYGAKIFIQITLGLGRSAAPGFLDGQPVAPSAIPNYWDPTVTCRELTTEEVETMVKKFGEAAIIAKESGFDGIEIHAVHEGYLLDQFTLSIFNKRTDKYGGDLKGRLTLPSEIVKEIKNTVGKDFPVMLRFSIKSYIKDWRQGGLPQEDFKELGRDVEEGLEVAKILQQAGYDAFNADCGTYDSWYWAHPPMYFDYGCYLPYAEKLKQVVSIPVISAGRMDLPGLGEKALQENKLDMVVIGRGLLADPYLPNKLMSGEENRIRPCLACHDGCMGRMFIAKPLSCAVNPATGREGEYFVTPACIKKNVLIVGGGLAGMEAARVAALRGHKVTIYEKRDKLGGHILEGSVPDFKLADKRLLKWYENELKELKIDVLLNTEITEDYINDKKTDVVVIASGSTSVTLNLPGMDRTNVCSAEDLLAGKKTAGPKIVMIGGGLIGCETALWLAKQGNEVTIVEALPELLSSGKPMPHMNRIMLLDLLKFNKVDAITNTSLLEVKEEGVLLIDKNFKQTSLDSDTVVIAIGYKPDNKLYNKLKCNVHELYNIGDSREASNIMNAIWDAYEVARNI
ncbi:FAD-dependent oxidoreductase [Clostridium sp.]|uniref:oxidoreductase n=1 Tax=Clostridium sp. TaxID=1506 RepID=UPI001A3B2241|nr:FAD-dependent oxidoreductase [Clostridium sp.]MBK5235455.1 FAD-dependent oxidoreductase [Clostridium sp.]